MTDAPIDLLAVALLDGEPCIETIPGTTVGPSRITGRGLFARRAWEAGEVLTVMDGQVVDVTRYPAVIDALEWNALSPELLLVRAVRTSYGFMNHSSRPNVSIDDDGRTVRAAGAIAPGRRADARLLRAAGARGLPGERRGGRPPGVGLSPPAGRSPVAPARGRMARGGTEHSQVRGCV